MIGQPTNHLRCIKCGRYLVYAPGEFLTCVTRDQDGNLCRGLIGEEQANREQMELPPIPKEPLPLRHAPI